MNQKSVQEYIARQEERYGESSRKEKSRILDDVVAVTGYHRKSVLRQLSGRGRPARGGQVGRPVEYDSKVAEAAALVHEVAGGIGARRLHPFVGELSARLVTLGELDMAPATEALLDRASPATLERMLADVQVPVRRKSKSLTKPGRCCATASRCGPSGTGTTPVPALSRWTRWRTVDRRRKGSTCGRSRPWTWRPDGSSWTWSGVRRKSAWERRYGRCTECCPYRSSASTATTARSSSQGPLRLLREQRDHLHQEQALPQERQRSRGAEERGCRPEGHGARTLLLLPSIQEVEGPLLPSQTPCQLLSAGPKAARQEPTGRPRRAPPRRRHDSLPAHGRERTAGGSAQSHP